MPIWRYILFVGGVLLALLFAADAVLRRPLTDDIHISGGHLPKIRIYSDRKGPEAIVFDTNRPTIVPDVTATADAPAAAAILGSPDPGVRESFAQQLPSALKQAHATESKKRRSYVRRKLVMGRHRHPPRYAADRSAFGWFESGW